MLSLLTSRWSSLVSRISDFPILSQLPTDKTIAVGTNIIIGTHDGSFHCDEVVAISLLKLLPKYENADIVRSRDPATLSKCSIVCDVGAKYEPEKFLFDHHQREFDTTLENYSTKLSSAGLIYKHFGKDIIRHLYSLNQLDDFKPESKVMDERLLDMLYHRIYKGFIEHIDAIDNGICVADAPLKYHISSTLSNRIGHFNPSWNQPQSSELANERFRMAMAVACTEFLGCVDGLLNVWWPARSIVESSLKKSKEIHSSGKIIVLDQFCPWKDHLFEIEKELSIESTIQYVIYKDSGGSFRIQAVPVDENSFDSRKKLPAPWRGIRDENLTALVGGETGCIFVHAAGFIGGHKTYDGALDMAKKAVEFIE